MDSIPNKRSEGLPLYKLVLRCAIFAVIFCVISILVIVLTSIIFYNTPNPTVKTQTAAFIALYSSAFITSFIMTRINGEKWLFGGLILGLMLFILTLVFSIFINGVPGSQSIIPRILVAVVALLAAFLGRKREHSKKPHHKKHIG